ncbi:MAG: hypothetical protein CMP57_03855 [Flavobacteriales bacterium]|nr:hypothetical protein [Flavobacteriales bacterium]|tara:strand:- start:1679 stop:2377 length:699 start_codon:yes stop_codon:yes gene_type:complete
MKHIRLFEDFLVEGRSAYDGLASKLTKAIFNKWVKSYKGGNDAIYYSDQIQERGLEFDIDATIHIDKKFKGFKVIETTGVDARDTDDEGDYQTPFINIDFGINPEWIPGEWSEVYFYLADVVRHEIEHITQGGAEHGNYRNGKPSEDDDELRAYIKMGILPRAQYLMLPKEVDANLQGLRYEAKKRKEAMIDTVNRYLDTQQKGGTINDEERVIVLDLWRRRAEKIGGIPKF